MYMEYYEVKILCKHFLIWSNSHYLDDNISVKYNTNKSYHL